MSSNASASPKNVSVSLVPFEANLTPPSTNNASKANNGKRKPKTPPKSKPKPKTPPKLKPKTPPKFQFHLDKKTKEQVLSAIEKAQQEEDDQPLLCIQASQSETKIEEKKLADLPVVKAFNEAERKKLSHSK